MRRLLDAAFVGEFAQHALERGAVGVLQAEGARDLAGADLAGLLADEGDDVVFGGEGRFAVGTFHDSDRSQQALLERLPSRRVRFTECQPVMTGL